MNTLNKILLLSVSLIAANASALTFRDKKLDSANHAYTCTYYSMDQNGHANGQDNNSGYCVIKDDKICFHPKNNDQAGYGILYKLSNLEYDKQVGDWRTYSIAGMEMKRVLHPEYNGYIYSLALIQDYPDTVATATCNLYWNSNNFTMMK